MIELSDLRSEPLRSIDDVASVVADAAWAESAPARPDRFGIEIEMFPMSLQGGQPRRRLLLQGRGGSLAGLDAVAASGERLERETTAAGSPRYRTGDGGIISFEPGGQIEHSTEAHATLPSLGDELKATAATLAGALRSVGAIPVPLGLDPWHRGRDVPQQLSTPRYPAMDAFFARRGAAGIEMMRNTCALQVNLDAGTGRVRTERWRAANAIAPLLTALFSTSPTAAAHNGRASIWRRLDPTRTGFPEIGDDPIEDMTEAALRADVMLLPEPGGLRAGHPGWSFGDWLTGGHPDVGAPTAEDLRRHLTTIFTEVRPRGGILELRSVDALPVRWQIVPVVLAAAALYDDETRAQILDGLSPSDHGAAWEHAARAGLATTADTARARWFVAVTLAGAERLGDIIGPAPLLTARRFAETYPMRGRTPADEVGRDDARDTLAWATGSSVATRGAA